MNQGGRMAALIVTIPRRARFPGGATPLWNKSWKISVAAGGQFLVHADP